MLLGAESFDLYGTDRANLLLRGYIIQDGSGNRIALVSNVSEARTGTGYLALRQSATSDIRLKKILDAAKTVIGQGSGFNLRDDVASAAFRNFGWGFGSGGNGFNEIKVNINADLGFTVWDGVTAVGSSAPGLVTIGTWNWVEIKVITGAGGTGSVEVRLNGEAVLTVTGRTISTITQLGLGARDVNEGDGSSYDLWIDDWVFWDSAGTVNNDFLGERRCVTSYPNADTADADWLPSTGLIGYQMIDESVPSDLDYIEATTPGDISEFQKQAIGIDTNDIAGIVVIARAKKTDAGASSFRLGLHSGAFVSNSDAKLPLTTISYFDNVFERNPNGNVAWTRAAADLATIRLTREA